MPENSTEQRVCDAMTRLLGGRSLLTDGRLTVTNLALEAGISRATANRYTAALDRFRRAVKEQKEEARAILAIDNHGRVADHHILAQHIQARAMLRQQEARRASRADVLLFPRQQR